MKIAIVPLAAGLISLSSLHGATLIEYTFDTQTSSTTYADVSGNGRSATFNRNVSTSTLYPFSTSYPSLQGIDLSAQTQYNASTSGAVANISGINLNTTQTFTLEGWVNLTGFASISGTPSGGTLWSMNSTTGGTSVFALKYTATGDVQASFNSLSQSGGTRTFDTGITLSLNTWTYLAYVKTPTGIIVYINGTAFNFSEAGITSRPLPTSLSSITIGSNIFGDFDDFRLSDAALSGSQLGYNAPFTVPEPATLALMIPALAIFFVKRKHSPQA